MHIPGYLVLFSRYSKLFVESRKFFLPHVYLAPPLRVTAVECHQELWQQKSRVLVLWCGIICVMICLGIGQVNTETEGQWP